VDRFQRVRWDDGEVVFDRLTGDTHALNALTAVVFDALQAREDLSNAALAIRALGCNGDKDAAALEESVRASRKQLVDAGLV
jgi:PqqD family protein of HPr-rel-A system